MSGPGGDTGESRARHWDGVWRERDPERVSWHQERPGEDWRMIETAGLPAGARVLDVGGGAATLVERMLELGYRPGVLDVSDAAVDRSRARLGPRAAEVEWYVADVTGWEPPHPWDLWHDRAVLHFLTEERDRDAYRMTLERAVPASGWAVFAEFGPEGPTSCSGLPVRRWSAEELGKFLGLDWTLEAQAPEAHVTPSGSVQKFIVSRFRRG